MSFTRTSGAAVVLRGSHISMQECPFGAREEQSAAHADIFGYRVLF